MIEVEEGTQNLYADIDSFDAEVMHRKALLVSQIASVIQAKGISPAKAADASSLNLEELLAGQFRRINETALVELLRILDREF